MRKHWERQSNANSWRETVSVILGDRDIQERQRGESEKHTHRAERRCQALFPDYKSVLAIETLSHWENLPSSSQDIFLGAGVSLQLGEGASPSDTPNHGGGVGVGNWAQRRFQMIDEPLGQRV